jgi:hypothetical protein
VPVLLLNKADASSLNYPGGHLKLYQAWPLQNVPARAL